MTIHFPVGPYKLESRNGHRMVESVLMAFVAKTPNATTRAAMKEAETSDDLETLDIEDFRKFVDSL